MNDGESPEFRVTDGLDMGWVLTHGAEMAWRYALSVQPALADIDAALTAGQWPLCVECCGSALRAIVYCGLVGRGHAGRHEEAELHARLATDASPAGGALRALPGSFTATEQDATAAVATVREHDASLRAALPFEFPDIRRAAGRGTTMRITATVSHLRRDRGLGPVSWNREGI